MKRWPLILFVPVLVCCVAASMVYLPHRRSAFRGEFTPSDIAGMVCWYKADELTGASTGDAVTNWFDSGPNGYTLVQSVHAKRPYFTNNAAKYNNLPWIQFTGSDDLIHAHPAIYAQPNTIFIVNHSDTIAGTVRIVVGTNASHYCSYTTTAKMNFYAGTALSGANSSVVAGTSYLLEATFNGVPSNVRTNSILYTSGNAGATSIAGLVVGSDPAEDNRWLIGGIAEIIIYNADVSGIDRTSLRTYFTEKYGPYANW